MHTVVEEFRRLRLNHSRNCDKYSKLLQETEAILRSRDAAANDVEVKPESGEKDGSFMNRSLTKVKVLNIQPSVNVQHSNSSTVST